MVTVSISWFRAVRPMRPLPVLPIGEREATD